MYIETHFTVSLSPLQSRSQAFVCVSTPRMYPLVIQTLIIVKNQLFHQNQKYSPPLNQTLFQNISQGAYMFCLQWFECI